MLTNARSTGETIREAFGIKCPVEVRNDHVSGETYLLLSDNEFSVGVSKEFSERIVENRDKLLMVLYNYPTLKVSDFISCGKHTGEMTIEVSSVMKCNYQDAFNLCILLISERK